MLRLLDTFSGIGGFSYAAERIVGGYKTIAFVEREPFCQKILRKHWPDVPIHDDITTFSPAPGSADVVCGGFPCQDISAAGKQAGIKEGTRSGLFYELMRVVRLVGPQYVVLENVAAITSNGLDTVLGTLAEAGFDAEWACIPAADVGACHRRDRWWCVAYANHAGVEAPRTEQLTAGAEQHRELDVAYATGSAREFQHSEWQEIRDKPAINGKEGIASRVAYASGTDQPRRSEGAGRRQCSPADAGSCGVPQGSRCADATAVPNGQRQQECQPAAIAGGSGRPCWGDAPQRLNPDWRSYLSEPVLCRGDDGLSGRVDRLKALGNAVVPQVAAIPLARVLEMEQFLR
jgi:site-specific DNA-cytosine methylase